MSRISKTVSFILKIILISLAILWCLDLILDHIFENIPKESNYFENF